MRHYAITGPERLENIEEPIPEPGQDRSSSGWRTPRKVQEAISTFTAPAPTRGSGPGSRKKPSTWEVASSKPRAKE